MQKFHNSSLKDYNSFGLDVSCKTLVLIDDEAFLATVLPLDSEQIFILGGGSNILLTGFLDKTVFKNEIKGIEIIQEDQVHALIEIGAGENWHELVLWAIDKNLGGIENLSLIPGTVGAAPIQNIGAYGVELSEVFESLDAFDLQSGEKLHFTKEDCQFGYRDSIFKRELKSKMIISKIRLKLTKAPHTINIAYGAIKNWLEDRNIEKPGIKDVSDAVISIRNSKLPDPDVLGNSGSFFKNPEIDRKQFEKLEKKFPQVVHYELASGMVKVPAGWLIEQCGWKGKKIGNVGCYKNQALVIVNHGNAQPSEIVNLSIDIRNSVEEKFGIKLETEVNFI